MSEIDDHLNFEEDFHQSDRKSEKKYRKMISSKDRSKYKKTDQEQLNKNKIGPESANSENTKTGRVLSISSDSILVDFENKQYFCALRGLLKKEKTDKKNLVAVGDFVYFEVREDLSGIITGVLPRYSILSRSDNLRKNKEQLLAVNIDQVLIVVSVFLPSLKPSLVDRYIIAAKKGNMTPVILLNKIDLIEHPLEEFDKDFYENEKALYEEFKKIYTKLGLTLIEISAKTNEGISKLKKIMEGKSSVFSGQSGVGKTSLINQILGTSYRTADVVLKTYKGAHTTTSAKLIPLENEAFCIDTPGIKSFGIWELDPQTIQDYFYEIKPLSIDCKFQNCTHTHEPGCAVKEALEKGSISLLRYESYYDLMTLPDDDGR